MNKSSKFLLVLGLAFVLSMSIVTFPVKASARVDEILGNMTTRQKVTQLLMPDFRNWKVEGASGETAFTAMNDEVKSIIEEYDFGGVILFAENVSKTEQTARLTHALQEAALSDNGGNGHKIPLLIGIDQEGGIVYRLGTGTALPGNMALGATRSEEHAKNIGRIIGRELSSLGINVNFAPVLDTNNNPKNPVIGLRSFSSNPELVGRLGVATIQGLKEYNVAGAAKHFPGHGDTGSDSHYDLPVVDKSLTDLKALEFVPFQAAMDEGIDMIMTAHIMFPQLDDLYPATLSKKILTDLIRTDMGYQGIIITDALNMKAIADRYGEIEATHLAIQAGVDIALMPTILRSKADITNKLEPMIEALVEYYEEDPAFAARVDESARRVLQLKEDRGILDYESTKKTVEEQVAAANLTVGSEENRNLEREISRDAVTVVKNENQVLPYNPKSGEKVLLVGAYANELPGMELGIRRLQDEGVIPSDLIIETALEMNGTTALTCDEIAAKLSDVDYLIVISEIGNESQLNPSNWLTGVPRLFMEEAAKLDIDATIMSISKPYDTINYPDADAVVAVFGNKGMDPTEALKPDYAFGPNISAGIEIIFGKSLANGKMPVDVPRLDGDYKMTSEIAIPYGFGLSLNEPAEAISLMLPASVNLHEELDTRISIDTISGITDSAYALKVKIDTSLFEIMSPYTINDGILIIEREADDTSDLVIKLRALSTGDKAPVLRIDLSDAKDRTFTLGEGVYSEETVTVNDLIAPLDTDELEALIEKAQEIDKTKYSKESADALEAAIHAAMETLLNTETQDELDKAVAALQTAMDSLVAIETPIDPENPDEGEKLPDTGISAGGDWLFGAEGMLPLGFLVYLYGRKKRADR